MFFTFPESLEEGVFECSSHSLDPCRREYFNVLHIPWRREYLNVLHIPWRREYLNVLHIPWIPAGGSILMFFTFPESLEEGSI